MNRNKKKKYIRKKNKGWKKITRVDSAVDGEQKKNKIKWRRRGRWRRWTRGYKWGTWCLNCEEQSGKKYGKIRTKMRYWKKEAEEKIKKKREEIILRTTNRLNCALYSLCWLTRNPVSFYIYCDNDFTKASSLLYSEFVK